jgi:hypothetical protein
MVTLGAETYLAPPLPGIFARIVEHGLSVRLTTESRRLRDPPP